MNADCPNDWCHGTVTDVDDRTALCDTCGNDWTILPMVNLPPSGGLG